MLPSPLRKATRGGVEGTNPVRIRTPLIDLSKAAIIKLGLSLGMNVSERASA